MTDELKRHQSVNVSKFGPLEMHFDDYGSHKLVMGAKQTGWAPYTQTTYLEGYVGHTAYYGVKENVVTADAFCKMTSVR